MTVVYESDSRLAAEPEGPVEKRDVWRAMLRGVKRRCPNCGTGKLFTSYLKVTPICAHCGEDLSQHRADDLPPYLTIVIVGHIVVPLILFVEKRWPLGTTTNLLIWLPITFILCLLLLPPTKGAVVGLQWALRMHGFDRTRQSHDDPEIEFSEPEPRIGQIPARQ
jgi:uncharacterized protein (DUF983 family)